MHQNPEPIPEQVANSIGLILSNSMLTESHAYLQQCERHPEFVRVLFNIFERLEVGPLREAVFLTCVNVIKRNMHHNRRVAAVVNLDSLKPFIKDTLIRYCLQRPQGLKWSYLKDLVKYIAYIEYPQSWPELQQLMLTNLEKLYKAGGILNEGLLEDVDLVRVVMKGEGKKSPFLKKSNVFKDYTIHIARPVELMSNAMGVKLVDKTSPPSSLDLRLSSSLDRILLSCLNTITSSIQTDNELAQVISRLLAKLASYLGLLECSSDPNYTMLVLKSIKRILLYAGVLQAGFPLLLAPILNQYLSMLMNLLRLSPQLYKLDRQQLVAKAAMMSTIRVLRTYAYYADRQSFAASIMAKSTPPEQMPICNDCHRQFTEFFSPAVIQELFNMVVTNFLGFRSEETEDELEEQDPSTINQLEQSPANIGSNLLSILMDRFKVQCGMIVGNILNSFISSGFSAAAQLQSNTYYMLQLLPNIYQEEDLPMQRIFVILEHLHNARQFNRHFALMVTRYYMMFNDDQLQKVFESLIEITVGHTDQITVFESCKALALILTKKEGSINLTNLPKTILRIIEMFPHFKNPTALRHLLKVINNILSNVEFDSEVVQQCVESPVIHEVLKKPTEALVYLLCEFLQGLLGRTSSPQVTRLSIIFLETNLSKELDNPEVIAQLWVTTIRNYQPGGQLQQPLLHIFERFIEHVRDEDTKCYCELLLEYMLLGLLRLGGEQLTLIVLEVLQKENLTQPERTQCWLLYFYSSIIHPEAITPPEIIRLMFSNLEALSGHPNASNIQVQSNLINIINLFICRSPESFNAAVCQILGVDSAIWIEIWLKHSRLLYTYESEKLLTVAILYMLEKIQKQHVETRFEWFVRVAMTHLDPAEIPQAVVRKGNPSRRKSTFRKHIPVMELDLKPLFREKFKAFLDRLGFTADFVRANIKSEETLQRLVKLLS